MNKNKLRFKNKKRKNQEKRSLNTIMNQLNEVRWKQEKKIIQIYNPYLAPNFEENLTKICRESNTFTVGDLMLSGIEEWRISK